MDGGSIGALAAVLAALGGVVKLVLDAMAKQDERHSRENDAREVRMTAQLEAFQERQEKFLTNHMSSNTRAMERVADQLDRLTKEVRER